VLLVLFVTLVLKSVAGIRHSNLQGASGRERRVQARRARRSL